MAIDWLSTLLGTGLTLGSTLPRSEPGSVTEARQFLRNQFTSPTGLTSQFTGQLGALNDQYAPYLQQQANQTLDSIQQRAIAGQPSSFSTAMGGPEISAMKQGFANQIVPQQQAHLADLARELMTRQTGAAGMLLGENSQNSLAQALGQLGGAFLNRGMGGGTQTSALGNLFGSTTNSFGNSLGSSLGSLFGGGGSNGLQQSFGLLGSSANPAFAAQSSAAISQALGGATIGGFEQGANGSMIILGQGGETLGTVSANGQIIGANGGVLGSVGSPTSGFTSMLGGTGGTMSGLMGLLAAGAGGYFSGQAIGSQLPGGGITGEGGGALAGAAGGAAAGAIAGSILPGIGTAIGAIVGAFAGLAGGFFGSQSATEAEKAANLKADMDSQASQGRAEANFFLPLIQATGGNTSGLMAQVAELINHTADPGDQQGQIAQLLGPALLQAFQSKDASITSLDMVPGLRQQFLDYLAQNAWVEPSAGERAPFSLSGPGGTGDILRQYEQYAGFTP